MSERDIDTTRAGGTGNAAPKPYEGAEPMSTDEALAYTADLETRAVLAPSHQATLALRREVVRLRDALPDLIRCAHGDAATCDRDRYGWVSCCRVRLAAIEHGLMARPERQDEQEDGA